MSREEIIQIITENIYPNGNNEITANVLNPVLDAMVNQINDITGDLGDLASTDTSSLVNAINSVITQFEGIDSNSVKLRSGIDNPNVTPPDEYNTADFYIQEDTEANPLDLWQFNGIEWTKQNSQPDGFTQLGTLSKTGNTINVGIGYAWIINDILESNTFAQEFIIDNESAGQSRVDIIVTDGNQFALIQGDSSAGEGSAAQPQIPVGSLLLTSIDIYEDNISEPTPPITGSDYLTKYSRRDALNGETGENVLLPSPTYVNGTRLVGSGLVSVDGYISGGGFSEPVLGDLFPITNVTGGNVILNDSANFITDNYVLPNKKVAIFRYEGNGFYRLVATSGGGVPPLQAVTEAGAVTTIPIVSNVNNGQLALSSAFGSVNIGEGSFVGSRGRFSSGVDTPVISFSFNSPNLSSGTVPVPGAGSTQANKLLYYGAAEGINVPTIFSGRQIPDVNYNNSIYATIANLALKANLAGGNSFTGNQVIAGSVQSNSFKSVNGNAFEFKHISPNIPGITVNDEFIFAFDNGVGVNFNAPTDYDIQFRINNNFSEQMTFSKNKNLVVGFAQITDSGERLQVNGSGKFSGVIFLGQFTDGTQPAYQKGATYFNVSISKMKIGGATAWETITSV